MKLRSSGRRLVGLVLSSVTLVAMTATLAMTTAAPAQATTGCSKCWGLYQNNDMYSDSLNGLTPASEIQYLSWTASGTTGPNVTDLQNVAAAGSQPFLELQTNCNSTVTATCQSNEQTYFADLIAGDDASNLQTFGSTIASTQAADGGGPVLLTFDHEFNEPSTCADDWYPWGTGCVTPADWITAWNIGTSDVDSACDGYCQWVWAPNVGTDASISSYWSNSGDQVSNVDYKGLDCYLGTYSDTWSGTCGSSWSEVSGLTGGGNEYGTLLTETGVNQTSVNYECGSMNCADAQLTEIADAVSPNEVFYFDQDNSGGTNWSLTPGEASCFLGLVVQGSCANVENAGTPSTCLDADSNNYPNEGDAIQLWSCDTNPEQEWQFTSAGQLENGQTGMCLDANSNDYPSEGDAIQLWSCNTNPEQVWELTSSGQLENTSSGLCLDANSKSYPNDGDAIQLWDCNTNPEQLWQFG
jgi:hypothetical protein